MSARKEHFFFFKNPLLLHLGHEQQTQQTMADLTPGPRKPPPAELTGFRSALAHTGIPHGVLLWKPRLPSRNWLIFWSVSLSLSYAYYYDRSECKRIKQEVVERVEKYGREPMPGGSLGEPRRVVVWAGRWGGDDDADRSGRYFRKYVKVRAGVVRITRIENKS